MVPATRNRFERAEDHGEPIPESPDGPHSAHDAETIADEAVYALHAVRGYGEVPRRHEPIGTEQASLVAEREQTFSETHGTVRTCEEDADARVCPRCRRLIGGFEECGEEASYFLPEEFPGQVTHAAEFRHLALHVCMAPLEAPAAESGEVVAASPSVAHERHDAAPHRRRQAAKHRLPIAPPFFAGTQHEERGEGLRARERTEEYHKAAVAAGRCSERKPEGVGNRDQGNVCGDAVRGMTAEPAPEALVKSFTEHFTVLVAALGETAE